MKASTIFNNITSAPSGFLRPHYQKNFLNFYFCLDQGCLETGVNCVTNCVMAKINPLEVRILEIIFS